MPRNKTVEMDLTLTLNATATVIYGAKGLVTEVFITEDTTVEMVYLDGEAVESTAHKSLKVRATRTLQDNLKESLNDQIVSSRT